MCNFQSFPSVHFPNDHYCNIFCYKLNYCKVPALYDDDDRDDNCEKDKLSAHKSISLPRLRLLSLSVLPQPLLPPSCWSVPCVATIAMIIISIKALCEYFRLLESNHPCLSILVHYPHLERSPLIAIRDATNPLWKAPLW